MENIQVSIEEQFELLTKNGVSCYEYEYDFTTSIDDFLASPGVKVAGRLGKINPSACTGYLFDATAKINVRFEINKHNNALLPLLAKGDIVGIEGVWESNGQIFVCREITLLTKARLSPVLPKTPESQLKFKHLLYINDANHAKNIFMRSETIRLLRSYMDHNDFLEIDTPLLHPFQGDSTSKPIFAELSAYDGLRFALASSPELYLKKMLVSGFNKVFSINKVFRDEKIDSTHLSEFTSIEYYMAYVDYLYMMDFTEKLLKKLAKDVTGGDKINFRGEIMDFSTRHPWKRLSIHESLQKYFKQDIFKSTYEELIKIAKSVGVAYEDKTSAGNIIIDVFEKLYLHTLVQPTFIYDFPKDASVMCYDITMAKDKRGNSGLLERFELYINGMELANCYSELNDPESQCTAFNNFLTQRNKDLNMDTTFYHALQVGMPPASGVGFGIDRLVMILSGSSDITHVTPFSTYHESL